MGGTVRLHTLAVYADDAQATVFAAFEAHGAPFSNQGSPPYGGAFRATPNGAEFHKVGEFDQEETEALGRNIQCGDPS